MTVGAFAELLFDPNDLSQQALREVRDATAKGDTVRGALERALYAQRIAVISEARKRLALEQNLNPSTVLRVLDYAWQVFAPRFVRIAGPQIALAYGRAMTAAQAGQVDNRYLTALAEQHARRLGNYFHESSKEALMEGFNTYLNRKVASRAALDRALASYGLTKRQTRGLAANKALDTKIASPMQIKQEARSGQYLTRSFSTRVASFVEQETHNLEMQAEQIAWMWLVEHDQAPKNSEKIWLTARDERTCKVCAPMHGKVVLAGERFTLPNNIKVWVPGVHPNCRCVARFRVPRQLEIAKADRPYYGDDPDERDRRGRFAARNRPGPRFAEPPPELKVDLTGVDEAQQEAERLREIEQILAEQVPVEPRKTVAPRKMVAPRQTVAPRREVAPRVEAVEARATEGAEVAARQQPKQKIQARMAQRMEVRVRDLAAAMVARRRAREERKAKSKELVTYKEQAQPLGKTFYTVLDPHEVSSLVLSNKLEFGGDQHWFGDEAAAAEAALEKRKVLVDRLYDSINGRVVEDYQMPNFEAEGPGDPEYKLYKFKISDNAAATLTDFLDQEGRIMSREDAMPDLADEAAHDAMGDDEVDISVYDQDEDPAMIGDGDEITIRLSQLAGLLGLSGEDFRVHVVEVDTGHKSKEGETEVYPGSRPEADTAMISGPFEGERQRHEQYSEYDPENLSAYQIHMDGFAGAIPITFHRMNPVLPEPVEDMRIFEQWNDDE